MCFFRTDSFSLVGLLLFLLVLGATSCTYKDRVAPVKLPGSGEQTVVIDDGLKIAGHAFTDPSEAQAAFGFNVRKAGLLPVQVTFQNDSSSQVRIIPEQTLLLDYQNNAWPVVSLEKTYQRTHDYVDIGETAKSAGKPALLLGAAGAIAGLAVGIISGENIGESMGKGAVIGGAAGAIAGGAAGYQDNGAKIKQDLREKSLKNSAILPNQIAYGVLFFPGSGDEAQSARELRLSLDIGGEPQVVVVPLGRMQ
jgi:hypothetical protein